MSDVSGWIREARSARQAHFVAFPELAITGYPPEDLLFKTSLSSTDTHRALKAVAAEVARTGCRGGLCRPGDDDGPFPDPSRLPSVGRST